MLLFNRNKALAMLMYNALHLLFLKNKFSFTLLEIKIFIPILSIVI